MPSSPRELRALVDEMKAQRASQAKSSDARDITAVALKQNWAVFDLMNTLLQTEGELSRATYELAACLKSEHNVWYAEIRFCAALHTLEGLTQDEAVGAVVDGLRRACATVGLRGGIILCALRSHPAPHPLETAKLARRWLGHGVVGFDVAGSETYALSLPAIVSALEACSEWGVPTTVHAGELPRGMLTNLRTALRLGVDRIGHGLALCVGDAAERGEDAELLSEVAGQDVLLEVCLTSNCTPSRVPSYAAHPVRRMFDAGVKIALSVDNLTLSGDPVTAAAYPLHGGYSYAHPSGEIAHLVADCGFSWPEVKQVLLNGVAAAFVSSDQAHTFEAFVADYASAIDSVLQEEGCMVAQR